MRDTLYFFCEALSCYDKLRDISKIVFTKYNYATFFKDIGCVKIARKEAQKAEIVLYENIDNLSLKTIANCRILHCMILASYHDEKEEFDKAINYTHSALNIFVNSEFASRIQGILFGNLANAYGKSGLFNRAKRYAKKQLMIGEIIGDPLCMADASYLIAKYDATIGNFKKASMTAAQSKNIYKSYGYIDYEKVDEFLEQIEPL